MATSNIPVPYVISAILLSNCNDAKICGRNYYCDSNTANRPTGSGWWHLHCIGNSGVMTAQIAVQMNATAFVMYGRVSNSAGTFGNWTKIIG